MSTPTKHPIVDPRYDGPGKPRAPKFKDNDIVHVLAAPTTTASPAGVPTRTATPSGIKALIEPQRVDEYVRKTTWQVTATEPSSSSGIEHVYQLQPANVVHITMPESRLLATRFLPDDIVLAKEEVAGSLYKVQEVKFARNEKGEVFSRYVAKDELGSEKVLDDAVVEKGDKREWFPVED